MGRGLSRLCRVMSTLVLCLAVGCMVRVPMVDEPVWYQQDSGMYNTMGGKRFFGVGRAMGIRSATLLKATASNAARKEIGRILQRYVTALAAEAASSLREFTLSRDSWEQLRGIVVRNAVQRSVISDHWPPGPNRLLALCELDMDTLKGILADDRLPDADARQAMWRAADTVHERLSRPFHSD